MILCNGEALIDMVPVENSATRCLSPLAGGAIFNTAIALGRLGVPTGYLSGLSTDLFGVQLEQTLCKSNVDASFTIRSDRPTTLAFVKLSNGHAEYTFYDENTAGRMITPADLPDIPASVQAMYFGGISLCSEPAASTYLALCEQYALRKVTMIDPNVRPGFVSDRAAYIARINRMIALADIVKVSDEDLDWLIPGDQPILDKLAALKAIGPSIAILTQGAKGPTALIAQGQTVRVPVPQVTVKDTVGAGDTFNAGVLAKLHKLGLLEKSKIAQISASDATEALALGVAVSAVTVSREGANPPWASELESEATPS
ncbi:carbohydrate kinase family protein [Candidatus Halocynthiibacter alkanivorans]|uniref:carbohydrate kinase family protein n=1 Tax=Candidatus Halocynthiibacter alkanivorans TaxID=2267619 RepID=UPI000DF1F51F|nr:carbohydrate kinase [Candidatus Halocynthiibacter alkanivorans]